MNLPFCRAQTPPPLASTSLGLGLKPSHYGEILATRPDLGFFEIHAENYMAAGGPAHRWLAAIAEIYPLSLHGVGLSLGSCEPLDRDHLARLKRLERLYRPALVSEHLAWCAFGGAHFPDLLPLPYDDAALARMAENISLVQETLGRRILIENPATYIRFAGNSFHAEPQFLDELAARTGCGLLLDVNNVHVAATNHGFAARDYLDGFPLERVEEIHLAGSAEILGDHGPLLIDDHGSPVKPEVWALYGEVLRRAGPRPTLIEWDNHVPDWTILLAEAGKAKTVRNAARKDSAPLALMSSRGAELRSLSKHRSAGEFHENSHWPDSQKLFAAALRDPALPVPEIFVPDDAQKRFAIYRNNSALACREALKEQFPTVRALVGDQAFEGLARLFSRQSPPGSPILGEYGAHFAAYLDSLPEVGAQTPYLSDLARLDCACLAALRAQEAEPADLSALAGLDMGRIGDARGKLHPSLALIESDWPLLALRAAHEKPVEDWSGGAIFVLRPQAELILAPCPPDIKNFVQALLSGASFAQAAEAVGPNFDFGGALVELTRFGAFTAFIQE